MVCPQKTCKHNRHMSAWLCLAVLCLGIADSYCMTVNRKQPRSCSETWSVQMAYFFEHDRVCDFLCSFPTQVLLMRGFRCSASPSSCELERCTHPGLTRVQLHVRLTLPPPTLPPSQWNHACFTRVLACPLEIVHDVVLNPCLCVQNTGHAKNVHKVRGRAESFRRRRNTTIQSGQRMRP